MLITIYVNSRLLVVKFWGSQTLYEDFQLSGVSMLLSSSLFKGKLGSPHLTVSTPAPLSFSTPSKLASTSVTLLELFLLKPAMAWKRGPQASQTRHSQWCSPLDSCLRGWTLWLLCFVLILTPFLPSHWTCYFFPTHKSNNLPGIFTWRFHGNFKSGIYNRTHGLSPQTLLLSPHPSVPHLHSLAFLSHCLARGMATFYLYSWITF